MTDTEFTRWLVARNPVFLVPHGAKMKAGDRLVVVEVCVLDDGCRHGRQVTATISEIRPNEMGQELLLTNLV